MTGELPTLGGSPCERHGCSACCHDIEMLLTEADLARLREARPELGDSFWFQADDGYLQLRTRDGPPARGGDGRPCIFLGADGRCTVYDGRPEGCRSFPAIWDEGLREAVLDEDYCPHTDEFTLPRAAGDATRRLVARLHDERDARNRRGNA
ncbi:MAG: YkgJ family cysteine cluster protein [Thermoplasmatota archaeon]